MKCNHSKYKLFKYSGDDRMWMLCEDCGRTFMGIIIPEQPIDEEKEFVKQLRQFNFSNLCQKKEEPNKG